MCFHDEKIALSGAHGGKVFYFFHAEDFHIFKGGCLLIFHHFLKIDADLHRTVRAVAAPWRCLCCLHLRHHLPLVALGDCGDLNAHICLVDGAYIVQFAAEFFHNIMNIAGKVGRCSRSFPSAFGHQPFRAGKMMQGNKRFHTVFFAAGDDVVVMCDGPCIKHAFLRLDARPFDRKTIGV